MYFRNVPALMSIIAGLVFLVLTQMREHDANRYSGVSSVVVLPAAVQTILYGGDRYMAANIESVRAAASGSLLDFEYRTFQSRTHLVASELNPCHEDNYWIGNAALNWGGLHDSGTSLLKAAVTCRIWDEFPPFFLGFNYYFFNRDVVSARRYLEIAATRSPDNTIHYRRFSIMLVAGEFDDAELALNFIKNEREKTSDAQLREMLDRRIARLNGLLILRNAQDEFENRYGRSLMSPQELLEYRVLDYFPEDPLRLGYEFRDGGFHLRQARIH